MRCRPLRSIVRCFLSTVVFLIAGCSQFGLSTGRVVAVGGEEVVVSIKQLDYHFDRTGHSDTYMVFGGGGSNRTGRLEYPPLVLPNSNVTFQQIQRLTILAK